MRVLVLIVTDSDAWHLFNICRKLKQRGHVLTVYSVHENQMFVNMFSELNLKVLSSQTLNSSITKSFDIALCGDEGGYHLWKYDIYTFLYSPLITHFAPSSCDFLFTLPKKRSEMYYQRCARMAIGTTKIDIANNKNIKDSKQILFIDSGHLPFGYEGKAQVADMLLQVCKENPDYAVVIKPRWLRGYDGYMTHRNTMHIYDVIEERCGGRISENMIMLNEHIDMSVLIQASRCVIALQTTAILDVLCYGKGLCIVKDFACEDRFDVRLKTHVDVMREYYARSGCSVRLCDVLKHMPLGIKSDGKFLHEVLPDIVDSSAKAADVMEFVFDSFLKYGKYPELREYSCNDYPDEMTDSKLTFDEIKQIRFENRARKDIAHCQTFLYAELDFSEAHAFIQNHYADYPFTRRGLSDFIREYNMLKNNILRANRELLMVDPIDQDILLRALRDTGYDDEIMDMRPEEILAVGPHHFFAARIMHERGETEAAIGHYIAFLEEANSRSFEKFYTETTQSGYVPAYTEIFNLYDGENVPPLKMCELICGLYESKRSHLISYDLHSSVYRKLYSLEAAALVDEESKPLYEAGKWIMIHEQFGKQFFLESEIMRLNNTINNLHREWFGIPHKVRRGFQCVSDHGLWYTIKYTFKGKFLGKLLNSLRTPIGMLRIFLKKVMLGYRVYSSIMHEFGAGAHLYAATFGVGDCYVLGKKYKAFCERLPEEQRPVYLVYTKSGGTIAQLFGIDSFAELKWDEFMHIFKLHMFAADTDVRLFALAPSSVFRHTSLSQGYLGYKGVPSFLYVDYYAYSNIPDSEICHPVFNSDGADELFREYSLTPGKTVMLAPNAKSVSLLPVSFWEKLAHRLVESGLNVCSNIATDKNGNQEAEIRGTVGVFVPYSKFAPFLEKCGALVSLRSGLSDVSESADCLNICLNRDTKKASTFYDSLSVIYSMERYYGRPNMHDLIYTSRTESALIDKIVNMITDYASIAY